MKKFSITYEVKGANGNVTYTVEASDRKKAIQMLKNGDISITGYEVEPTFKSADYDREVFEDPDAEPIN